MLTISCINQKGGAGKTTIAVHLAAHAVAKGYRTLVIDLDTQASASLWGDRRGERDPDVVSEHSTRLERSLQAAAKEGYEVVIVDTAPNVDQAALKAAQASDRIIVPVRPATFDLGALKSTLDLVEMAQRPATIVLNQAPIRSRVIEEAIAAIRKMGGKVSPHVIRQRVAYQHCLIEGLTAEEYEPDGTAASEIGALCADVIPVRRKPKQRE